jgi:rhodanese-related sulfurtransferase
MKLKYILPAILLFLLGFILLFLPEPDRAEQLSPEELLADITDNSRYISTDDIARRLVEQDPSLVLVDVRSMYDYEEFTLPGAFSIPLEEILLEDWKDYLEQEGKDVVFFSNADILADQAWILSRRTGKQDIFVMKGGLNEWFATIIKPTPPPETAPAEAFDLYQFRRGACQYFVGGNMADVPDMQVEQVEFTRKKKKNVVEGGC